MDKNVFRADKNQKVEDADAGKKPLSSDDKSKDKQRVEDMAVEISALQDILYAQRKHKILIVLQGMDTAGKDGAVRGVFGRIDPLGVSSVPFKVPTPEEKAHDFLWRIHQHVPGEGEIVIFNRSHYEDVLVTRVHGWIDEKECVRRYAHIRDFERMLTETGTVVLKFFLHISKDEQKERLEERIANPEKHWKLDSNDLAERKFWDAYQIAYAEAIRQTNTYDAPWYIVPADSKTHRNLVIASIVLDELKKLNLSYPPGKQDYANMKVV